MHEVNISPPHSLGRFFLNQQLIYKSKIEKHNVSLDNIASSTSIVRKLHLPGLEKIYFSCIRIHTDFLDQILVFALLEIKERLRIKAL